MLRYAIMIRPNHNIAYFNEYLNMCYVELNIMAHSCSHEISNLNHQSINKSTVLTFNTNQDLSAEFLRNLFYLSFFHTLFKIHDDHHYQPLMIHQKPIFQDDLSIRLKYNGKTNEQITRFMLSVAYHTSHFTTLPTREICVLDPLCGRGTTLFEAMIRGFNAYGVEQDKKSVAEMEAYITRYLRELKIKHQKKKGKAVFKGKQIGEFFDIAYAKDKSALKQKQTHSLKVVRADTQEIEGVFKKESMHLIVADLPYNIQHTRFDHSTQQKGLSTLLIAGLKSWTPSLKVGGVIALSWNIYTDTREGFIEILTQAKYDVLNESHYASVAHRVSQAIQRDIIFAIKT